MKITYTEEKSYFSHNGGKYDLNKIFLLSEKIKVQNIELSKFDWLLNFDFYTNINNQLVCGSCENYIAHRERLRNADITVPILVTIWEGKYLAIDGFHRIEKIHISNITNVPCKIIGYEEFEIYRIE